MAEERMLKRITNIGVGYVDDDFLLPNRRPIEDSRAYEDVSLVVEIDEFHKAVDNCIKYHDRPSDGDAWLAAELHRRFHIPRQLAMDIRIWRFLTCIDRPDYVEYRWGRSGRVAKERFLGSLKRNAFSRLWWAAEILKENDDYPELDAVFQNQDLYEAVFGRAFSKYPPAAKAFIRKTKNQKRETIRTVAKDFNLMLSTFLLEYLEYSEISELVESRVEVRKLS